MPSKIKTTLLNPAKFGLTKLSAFINKNQKQPATNKSKNILITKKMLTIKRKLEKWLNKDHYKAIIKARKNGQNATK